MALPSSFPMSLDDIIEEVFGSVSHPTDFLTCVDSSLIIDKSRPIGFEKFLGYVDNITFTSSPTSHNWAYNDTTPEAMTVVVDSAEAHIHSIPTWITIKDNTATQIFAGDTIYKSGTPSYVLNVEPTVNTGTDRSDNIVVHIATALGNAYQTQSATSMNIGVSQDHVPIPPSLGGWSVGLVDADPPVSMTLTGTAVTGISLGSDVLSITFTPNGTFTAGNRQVQVFVGSTSGTRLYNSVEYMSDGVAVGDPTPVQWTLSRPLAEDEDVFIVIGEDAV